LLGYSITVNRKGENLEEADGVQAKSTDEAADEEFASA
jgi:hypothetical protein